MTPVNGCKPWAAIGQVMGRGSVDPQPRQLALAREQTGADEVLITRPKWVRPHLRVATGSGGMLVAVLFLKPQNSFRRSAPTLSRVRCAESRSYQGHSADSTLDLRNPPGHRPSISLIRLAKLPPQRRFFIKHDKKMSR